MKNLTKLSLSVILVITSLTFKAQDTIYFKNTTSVIAKISEVGMIDVTYRRFDNIDGPIYVVQKKDIEKIKYSNGSIETFSLVSSVANEAQNKNTEHSTISQTSLKLEGTDLLYMGKPLGKIKTYQLLKKHLLSENQILLITELKEVKSYKNSKKALGNGLFLAGFGVPLITSVAATGFALNGSLDSEVFIGSLIAGAVAGIALRVAGRWIYTKNRHKSEAKKLEFLRKHNPHELIY